MAKSLTARQWMKQTEAETKIRHPTQVAAARSAFNQLDRETQSTLVEELVETRSAELCRAYRNVIDVSIAFKRRCKASGDVKLIRKPCVRFLVKKKWTSEEEQNPDEELPKFLFSYSTLNGERRLCAIPTDVVSADEYAHIVPQSNQIVVTPKRNAGDHNALGVITCVVKRSEEDEQAFAIGCRHVFSITKRRSPRFFVGTVQIQQDRRHVGETRNIRGEMVANKKYSFDAQASVIEDLTALRQCLDGLKLDGYAGNHTDIPNSYWIQVPGRAPVKAENQSPRPIIGFGINYSGVGLVFHQQLIEGRALTRGGDSGSPCTSRKNGGLLLGMHIAGPSPKSGTGPGPVFMIPAWQLMRRSNYKGASSTDDWVLVGNP